MTLFKKSVFVVSIACLLTSCGGSGTRHVSYSSYYSTGWGNSMYYDPWYRGGRDITVVVPPRRDRPEIRPRPPRTPPARPRPSRPRR